MLWKVSDLRVHGVRAPQAAAAPKVARRPDGSRATAAALLAAAAETRAANGDAAAPAANGDAAAPAASEQQKQQQQEGTSNGRLHVAVDGEDGQRRLMAAAQAAQAAYHKAALRQHLLALGAQKKARGVRVGSSKSL